MSYGKPKAKALLQTAVAVLVAAYKNFHEGPLLSARLQGTGALCSCKKWGQSHFIFCVVDITAVFVAELRAYAAVTTSIGMDLC